LLAKRTKETTKAIDVIMVMINSVRGILFLNGSKHQPHPSVVQKEKEKKKKKEKNRLLFFKGNRKLEKRVGRKTSFKKITAQEYKIKNESNHRSDKQIVKPTQISSRYIDSCSSTSKSCN